MTHRLKPTCSRSSCAHGYHWHPPDTAISALSVDHCDILLCLPSLELSFPTYSYFYLIIFLFKDFLNYCKNYVYVCVYVHEYRSLWRPEVLDSLKLWEAPNTGAGNQTLVFCKNSISSYHPAFPSPDLISILNYHCLVSTIASATSFMCVTLADSQKPQTQQTLQMRKCGARGHSVNAT